MADPNVYYLNIMLQVDAAAAFSTLEEFGKTASDVEGRISDAAQNTINSIAGVADALNQNIANAASTTKEFASTGVELQQTLTKAADAIKDAYNIQSDSLEDMKERLKFLEEIEDIQEKLEKSLEAEHNTGQEYLNLIDSWTGALKDKNLIHKEEGGLLDDELDQVDGMVKGWDSLGQKQISSKDIMAKIRTTLGTIWALIKLFDKETENFVQANYRAYGSQQQLVNSTRELSSELGIARGVSIGAYKALADVKTPREEIHKLARVVAMANRTTGVAEQQIAEYTRSLRVMGFDAEKTRKQVEFMTEAMRKYGLSQHDVNTLMSIGGVDIIAMGEMFGGVQSEVAKFEQSRIHLAGFGKELGLTADGANQFFIWLSKGLGAMEQFGALAEMNIQSAADFEQAQVKAGLRIHTTLTRIRKEIAAGVVQQNALKAQREAWIEANFNGNEEAFRSIEALGKQAAALGLTGDAVGDYAKLVGNLSSRQMDQWSEANNTLTGQLVILKSIIVGALGPAIQWLADGLKIVLKVFIAIIKPIAWVITKFIGLVDWIEANIPVLGWFVTAFKVVLAVLGAVAIALLVTATSLVSFATAWAGAATMIAGAGSIIAFVASTIISIAAAMGTAIVTILTSIGAGLLALGTAVAPVILPLMGLGLIVLMIGGGFYLMGLGMMYAAREGWAVIGMLAAMTVAFVIMAATFALISSIAGPVIPLMLALAAVVLILGAAAYLAGLGMKFIGSAVETVAEFGLEAAAALPPLAKGVLLLGLAGLVGSAGIMMAAYALMLFGAALWLIASPLAMLTTVFEKLSGEAIIEFADALLASSWKITVALFALLPAIAILPTIAVGILVAGAVLITAGALFVVATTLIGFGAKLLGEGMLALAEGAKAFKDVNFVKMAFQLLIGGVMLMYAGASFVIGATLVGIGALLLGYGLQSLGPGAKALKDVNFVKMAMDLAYGSFILALAGPGFVIAAGLIGIAAILLGAGLWMLGKGAQTLEDIDFAAMAASMKDAVWQLKFVGPIFALGAAAIGVAAASLGAGLFILGKGAQQLKDIDFEDMARQLAVGGELLVLAAVPLILGSIALSYASVYLLAAGVLIAIAGPLLESGAAKVKAGADDLYASGWKLLTAGLMLMVSGPLLVKGSASLFWGSFALVGASIMLMLAGKWIVPAAIAIALGMWWLDIAVHRFSRSIGVIEKMGFAMALFANSFGTLKNAPIGALGEAADAALKALPKVDRVGRELNKSATIFQRSADKFVKPVREITDALEGLGGAMAAIGGQGIAVQEDMDKLGAMLEKYTQLLEGTAIRIEAAVVAKAIPAMDAAKKAGIAEAVRSEAITTVQVMDKTEGEVVQVDAQTELIREQTTFLKAINEQMGVIAEGGGNELTTIVELLETYLPDLNTHKSGLTTEFNQWMK